MHHLQIKHLRYTSMNVCNQHKMTMIKANVRKPGCLAVWLFFPSMSSPLTIDMAVHVLLFFNKCAIIIITAAGVEVGSVSNHFWTCGEIVQRDKGLNMARERWKAYKKNRNWYNLRNECNSQPVNEIYLLPKVCPDACVYRDTVKVLRWVAIRSSGNSGNEQNTQ